MPEISDASRGDLLADIVEFKRSRALDAAALDTLFHHARSANRYLPKPVDPEVLRSIVDCTYMAPTSANSIPLRIVFVKNNCEALKAALLPGNVAKIESPPVTAILARDLRFYEHLPHLYPQAPQMYLDHAKEDANAISLENAYLQAGYFILSIRAHGLDAGPVGGFSREALDGAFFGDGTKKSILLVTLGYGDDSALHPRNPRLGYEEIVSFA